MKNQIAKGAYLAPETEVIEMRTEISFCTSVNATMAGPWETEEDI